MTITIKSSDEDAIILPRWLMSVLNLEEGSFDEAAARRMATLHHELLRNGLDIGIKDTMIAAIALEHNLALLTLNERHFMRVPGLQMISIAEFLTPS